MNKLLVVGGVVVVVIFLSAVAFFVMVYPKLITPQTTPVVTPQTQTLPTKPVAKPTTPLPPVTVNQIKLTISTPVDKSIVTTPTIVVSGLTVAAAEVYVNELELKADSAGKFSTKLILSEGDNPIVVSAVDTNGNYSEQEITVTYQPATQ